MSSFKKIFLTFIILVAIIVTILILLDDKNKIGNTVKQVEKKNDNTLRIYNFNFNTPDTNWHFHQHNKNCESWRYNTSFDSFNFVYFMSKNKLDSSFLVINNKNLKFNLGKVININNELVTMTQHYTFYANPITYYKFNGNTYLVLNGFNESKHNIEASGDYYYDPELMFILINYSKLIVLEYDAIDFIDYNKNKYLDINYKNNVFELNEMKVEKIMN